MRRLTRPRCRLLGRLRLQTLQTAGLLRRRLNQGAAQRRVWTMVTEMMYLLKKTEKETP